MLLGGITVLSVLIAAVICACVGGFAGFGWLWLLPVGFAGSFLILMGLAFLFLWAVSAAVKQEIPQEHDSLFHRRVANLYIELVMILGRVRVETRGLEKTPKEGRFLLVCNHLNDSDPAILLHFFRKSQLAFISKRENKDMFIVGKLMHKFMCQLINRENDRDALQCILKCIQLIKDDEVSIAVFPEGYVSKTRKLLPLRSGVFKIAQRTQVPIVVCTIQGSQHVFRNLKRLKPSDVKLHLVDVIQPEEYRGMTTVDIANRVHELMVADLDPEYRPSE